MPRRNHETNVPYVYRDSGGEYRTLNCRPSDEILRLAKTRQVLFDESSVELCQDSPKNFIGAMVTMLNQRELMQIIENYFFRFPLDYFETAFSGIDRLKRPVVMLSDVPLVEEQSRNLKPELVPLGPVVPSVLFKQFCGARAGVVLTGPLAGLILETVDFSRDPGGGLLASRIWNDHRLLESDPPSPPRFSLIKDKRFGLDLPDGLQRELYLAADEIYLRSLPDGIWTTELFFRFCRELEIEVDETNFTFSRSGRPDEQAVR